MKIFFTKHVGQKKYLKHSFSVTNVFIVFVFSVVPLVVMLVLCVHALSGCKAETHDHFVGTYAFKATPYWPEFKISKDNEAFTFQHPGDDDWKNTLKLHGNQLIGKDKYNHEVKISYDPAISEYAMSMIDQISTYEGTQIYPQKLTLVKVLSIPNEKLEKEYGVKAVDLVKKVRQSEDWIHKVKSLKIIEKHKSIKSPKGIESSEKEVKERFPDADLSNKLRWGLNPEQEGGIKIYFDDKRFRKFSYTNNRDESLRIWDGQEFVHHEKYYTHDQEHYAFRKELPARNYVLLDLMWPRSKHYDFWWEEKHDINWEDVYGRAEDFIIVGKEKYRDTLCYVIECYPKDYRRVRRWFVGVKDCLKYGDLTYERGQLFREGWTGDYKELKPGWWFPMKQGFHSFNNNEGNSFIRSTRQIMIEDIQADKKLDDSLFVMEFKDGVDVNDDRFGGFITYKYKKDRTEQEWEQLRQKAQARVESDLKEKRNLDIRIGQDAMVFPKECKWLNTEPLTIEKLRGKAIILQFWGYWCGPCHNFMNMLSADQSNKNIVVIGVHTPEEDLKKIEDDMKKYKADGPICVDIPDERSPGLISNWYRVLRWPYWVVIGPDGKVVGHSDNLNETFQLAQYSLIKK